MTSDGGRAISLPIGVLTGGVPGGLMEDLDAAEVDFWEQGGHIDKNFAVSVYPAPRTPARRAPLIDHLVDGSNLLGVFWFNDETQSYLSYDPDPDFAFQRPGNGPKPGYLLAAPPRPAALPGEDPPRRLEPGGATVGVFDAEGARLPPPLCRRTGNPEPFHRREHLFGCVLPKNLRGPCAPRGYCPHTTTIRSGGRTPTPPGPPRLCPQYINCCGNSGSGRAARAFSKSVVIILYLSAICCCCRRCTSFT